MEPRKPQGLEQKSSHVPRPLPPPPTAGPPPAPSSRMSFSQRKSRYRNRQPSLEPVIEGDTRFLREIRDPPPGDTRSTRRQSKPDLAKRRSQYFEDAFQDRDKNSNPGKDKVREESMVLAEVKTNVIIHDEFAFIMELSHHLSERYNRPLGCIVVTLHHRMCLFFGGTFAPAYCITISALPSQIQTATNKRNLLLLQLHLEKTLKVFPTRGIVRYLPVEEDCFGWNKRTIASEMAEVETQGSEVEVGEVRRRRTLPSMSMRRSISTTATGTHAQDARPTDEESELVQDNGHTEQTEIEGKPVEKKIRAKRSFMHTLFQRSGKSVSESPGDEERHSTDN